MDKVIIEIIYNLDILYFALKAESVEELQKNVAEEIELKKSIFSIEKINSNDLVIEYLVAKYDNDKIHITIDGSRNHSSPHIHIGVKADKYHTATIIINTGEVIVNSETIAAW